jgi:hypothetical protein
MSGSSVLVALNALALKRVRLPRAETSAEQTIAERPKGRLRSCPRGNGTTV